MEIFDPTLPNEAASRPGPPSRPRGRHLPEIAFGAQTTLAYSENSFVAWNGLGMTDGRHARPSPVRWMGQRAELTSRIGFPVGLVGGDGICARH